ncbi:Uncharacterised protein [Mycobacteroides abscessus subsp. abscessus]|nr:Uncharacterised protein [Mycobacteroides abscessus subsp. abscessus]
MSYTQISSMPSSSNWLATAKICSTTFCTVPFRYKVRIDPEMSKTRPTLALTCDSFFFSSTTPAVFFIKDILMLRISPL